MSWGDFWIILICCSLTILACRVLPLFLLKGKELPESISRALGFIPPAAFAALVANDIFAPGMFGNGIWPAAAVLVASACVVIIAVKSRSLLLSAVGGVVVYAILLAI